MNKKVHTQNTFFRTRTQCAKVPKYKTGETRWARNELNHWRQSTGGPEQICEYHKVISFSLEKKQQQQQQQHEKKRLVYIEFSLSSPVPVQNYICTSTHTHTLAVFGCGRVNFSLFQKMISKYETLISHLLLMNEPAQTIINICGEQCTEIEAEQQTTQKQRTAANERWDRVSSIGLKRDFVAWLAHSSSFNRSIHEQNNG